MRHEMGDFKEQLAKMRTHPGFIGALDQSGGSTPGALRAYGIKEDAWSNKEQMFAIVHQMRTRIITSPVFTGDRILGAILFENTMDRDVEGQPTADYLWNVKRIVPFLKVDKGLAAESRGVQLMKPMPKLASLLDRANAKRIFGTKMRSFIKQANGAGINDIVTQQFEVARQITAAGLVPIVEPEVDIHCPQKAEAEELLKSAIVAELDALPTDDVVMLKLTLPEKDDHYAELVNHPKVVRVVALSGGYTREEGNRRLRRNHGVVASFSRALVEGLSARQSDAEYNALLDASIQSGHFVKMVHNGIEYGIMAAYAEGLGILRSVNVGKQGHAVDAETTPLRDPEHYQYDFNLPDIAEVWRRGSVVASWLLDLSAAALIKDPQLENFQGRVSDSGEGRWTIRAAIDEAVPAPVLSSALYERFSSRGEADFGGKLLSAMRYQFGGHLEKPAA